MISCSTTAMTMYFQWCNQSGEGAWGQSDIAPPSPTQEIFRVKDWMAQKLAKEKYETAMIYMKLYKLLVLYISQCDLLR